jgi:galactokinase
VAAEKTGAALESYNRLARGAAALLELWNTSEPPEESLASALKSHPGAEERLTSMIRNSSVEGWSAAALEDRLRQFVREDRRVPEAMRAFDACDEHEIGRIAVASQEDSRTLLRNQVDETLVLSRLALERGAIGARSFGAGFGGSVWAIVTGQRTTAEKCARRGLDEYRIAKPDRKSVAFIARPAPGVVELPALDHSNG